MRLFDAEGIKPEKYLDEYPELRRISEFSSLSGRRIVFVWWYANVTSPLFKEQNKVKRAELALEKSGLTLSKPERDKILKLDFDESMVAAIERMGKFDVSRRYRANDIVKTIFDNFETMSHEGLKGFSKSKIIIGDNGEEVIETNVDYSKYIDASAKIVSTLPFLLERLEEGFGTDINTTEEDAGEFNSDWYKNKTQ